MQRLAAVSLLFILPLIAAFGQDQPITRDLQGDPLPKGAMARLGTIRWRHDGIVGFAAILPDGKSALTVGDDRTIRIWEFPSGNEIRRITATTNFDFFYPRSVALSQDYKTLAAGLDGGKIGLFDVASGKELFFLSTDNVPDKAKRRPHRAMAVLAFSPDGTRLAAIDEGDVVHIWDLRGAKEICFFSGGGVSKGLTTAASGESNVVWAPDGKAIVTANLDRDGKKIVGNIKVWDPATGKEIHTIKTKEQVFSPALAFSPDGKILAFSTYDGSANAEQRGHVTITFADPSNGKEIRRVRDNLASWIAFSKDSTKIYTYCFDIAFVLQEIEVATGKLLRKIGSSESSPMAISLNRIGLTTVMGGNVLSADDSKLVLPGSRHLYRFFDLVAGKEMAVTTGHRTPLMSIAFAPDGKSILTLSSDRTLKKWNAAAGEELASLLANSRSYVSTRDYRIGAGWNNGKLFFFDVTNGKQLGNAPLKTNIDSVWRFSPDGKTLAVRRRRDQRIELYEVPTAKLIHSFTIVTGALNPPQPLIFSPDNTLLASHGDPATLFVWDLTTGKHVSKLSMPEKNAIQFGEFSPDGRCLVFDMNDGSAKLFELATGQTRRTFTIQQGASKSKLPLVNGNSTPFGGRVDISPDGKLLAQAGADNAIHLWDIAGGQQVASLEGHRAAINALAFAPDGKSIASAASDKTGLLWNVSHIERAVAETKPLDRIRLEACWSALADDAAKAFDAICELSAVPKDALPFLKEHVKPSAPVDGKLVQELIGKLDDDQFKVRTQANNDLLKIGESIVPIIDAALVKGTSAETRNRLEGLRAKLTGLVVQGERLRDYRAVEVLDRIGTHEARELLQKLSDGAPGTLLTNSAQAALKRL